MTTTGERAVRRLSAAAFVSATWSEAAYVALAFTVFEQTGSTVWAAAVFLLTLGLPGVLTPISGVIVDRFDRRRVLVVSDLCGAAAFVVLVFTQDRVAMLAVAFVAAVVELPFYTATQAAIPNLVSPDRLAWANATRSLAARVGIVLGAGLGGFLVDAIGPAWVFGLNAASFAVSSGLVASIRHVAFQGERDGGEEEHRGALAGFRFLRRDAVLAGLLVAWTIMFLSLTIVLVADLPLVSEFGVGGFGYGLTFAAWGVGELLGNLFARKMSEAQEPAALIAEMLGAVAGYGLVAASPWFPVVIVGMVITAVSDAIGSVAGNALTQRRTPDPVRGRVFAAYWTAGLGANSIGFLAAGFLVDAVGWRGIYAISAAASTVAAILMARTLGRTVGLRSRSEDR